MCTIAIPRGRGALMCAAAREGLRLCLGDIVLQETELVCTCNEVALLFVPIEP